LTDNPFVAMIERMKERAELNKKMGIVPREDSAFIYDCPICQDREVVPIERDGFVNDVAVCSCKAQKAQKRLFRASGLTDQQSKFTLGDYKVTPETMKMVQAVNVYLGGEVWKKGEGFMLSGTVGIGKSMLAQIIANHILIMGQSVVFVPTNSLMAELRAAQFSKDGMEFEQKIEILVNADVVIFDDLGKEKCTEWVQAQYFRIIDSRYNKRKATGFTSNYNLDQLADRFSEFGEAIISRIIAMTMGYCTFVSAMDYRVLQMSSKEKWAKKID